MPMFFIFMTLVYILFGNLSCKGTLPQSLGKLPPYCYDIALSIYSLTLTIHSSRELYLQLRKLLKARAGLNKPPIVYVYKVGNVPTWVCTMLSPSVQLCYYLPWDFSKSGNPRI